jgi:hypothetical protein
MFKSPQKATMEISNSIEQKRPIITEGRFFALVAGLYNPHTCVGAFGIPPAYRKAAACPAEALGSSYGVLFFSSYPEESITFQLIFHSFLLVFVANNDF